MTEVQTATSIIGGLVVVIIALCEAIKYAGLPSRFIPLLSMIFGILGVWIFGGLNFIETLAGVVIGLATTGGYRLIKTTILNK